ncbi:MAG TPA: type IV toxin-antitoxin system AbiEi family antitoxin domain-containing protein [Longimicrobium sp.]|nr:type IV toxin-antitoxin system AbiEi family antitoxin domain-containing protein [Longimicrobium sp.]
MPGNTFAFLAEATADQFGYFTAKQARTWGIQPNTLVMMAKRNSLERLSHGVYRLAHFPVAPLGQYVEATFWPGGTRGVISHQSALALYGVSDVSPARIHLTVPARFRTHRRVPRHLALHRANVPETQVEMVEGVPVTTLERAITDCAREHLGPELIEQAIDEGRQTGRLTRGTVARLKAQLLSS